MFFQKIIIFSFVTTAAHGLRADEAQEIKEKFPSFPPFPEFFARFKLTDHELNDGLTVKNVEFVVFKKIQDENRSWQDIWKKNNCEGVSKGMVSCQQWKFLRNIISEDVCPAFWQLSHDSFTKSMFDSHFDESTFPESLVEQATKNELEAKRRVELLQTQEGILTLLDEQLFLKEKWIGEIRNSTLKQACRAHNEEAQLSEEEILNILSNMMLFRWLKKEDGEETFNPVHSVERCCGDGSYGGYNYISMAVHNVDQHLTQRNSEIFEFSPNFWSYHNPLNSSTNDFRLDQSVHVKPPKLTTLTPEQVQFFIPPRVTEFTLESLSDDPIEIYKQQHLFTERYWPNNFVVWKENEVLSKRLAPLVHCAGLLAFEDVEGSNEPSNNTFLSVGVNHYHHMRNAFRQTNAVVDGPLDGEDGKTGNPDVWTIPPMFAFGNPDVWTIPPMFAFGRLDMLTYCKARLEVVSTIPKGEWN